MVLRPTEHRWSSAAVHLLGTRDKSGILDMEFWRRAGGTETWAQMYDDPGMPEQTIEFRRCTYSGRPFGDAAFVTSMEERFGRKWRRIREGGVRAAANSA